MSLRYRRMEVRGGNGTVCSATRSECKYMYMRSGINIVDLIAAFATRSECKYMYMRSGNTIVDRDVAFAPALKAMSSLSGHSAQ